MKKDFGKYFLISFFHNMKSSLQTDLFPCLGWKPLHLNLIELLNQNQNSFNGKNSLEKISHASKTRKIFLKECPLNSRILEKEWETLRPS